MRSRSSGRVGLEVPGGGGGGPSISVSPTPVAHFTANAWGGPTYLGAMYCHYLDLGLISAAAALLIDRLLAPHPLQNTSTTRTAALG